MDYIVGIDIAKDKFDVCLVRLDGQQEHAEMSNTPEGFRTLRNWLKKRGAKTAHVCMEATGIYGEALAEELEQRGYLVSVVNPARIKAYAGSQMTRNKTDKIDARLIADFCRTQKPEPWTPPAPELKELRALVRHLETLKQESQRAQNRLESTQNADVRTHLQAQIKLLDVQIAETLKLIQDHINKHPGLKSQQELLTSITGVGPILSSTLIAEYGDMRRFDNVREVVAFAGLNPRHHQSGRKTTTRGISRMGRAALRATLYMPAISALRHNPVIRQWAQGLTARGLTRKQVIVAAMRKLLHLAYGVLKSGKPFDVHYNEHHTLSAA